MFLPGESHWQRSLAGYCPIFFSWYCWVECYPWALLGIMLFIMMHSSQCLGSNQRKNVNSVGMSRSRSWRLISIFGESGCDALTEDDELCGVNKRNFSSHGPGGWEVQDQGSSMLQFLMRLLSQACRNSHLLSASSDGFSWWLHMEKERVSKHSCVSS